MIKAPWNKKQVHNLFERQECETMHPYTCLCGTKFVPTVDGWWCNDCQGVMQDWAHTSDVTDKFKDLIAFRAKLDSEIDALLTEV